MKLANVVDKINMEIKYSGSSAQDAVAKVCDELGIAEDGISYKYLMERFIMEQKSVEGDN